MLKIIIRVDASIQIGIGHVMRCLTLAHVLRVNGSDVCFVCRDCPGHLQKVIKKQGFRVVLLPKAKLGYSLKEKDSPYANWLGLPWQQDVEEVKNFLKHKPIDWVIVDHYGIDYRWHESIRLYTKKIMVIDDLADRKLDCDLLLDQTSGRELENYASLIPGKSHLLLGTNYALLRPEFKQIRRKAIDKRRTFDGIRQIIVSMGSMDPNNLTGSVLSALEEVKWKHAPIVDVVLGGKAPFLKSIIDQSKNHLLEVNICQDVSDMSQLMLRADLAIGAGGTTSWERCILGLPSLVVKLAENQVEVIGELVKLGVARRIYEIESDVVLECNNLIQKNTLMSLMSENAFKVVDGQGAELAAIYMHPDVTRDGSRITIRNANMHDVDLTFQWQLNPNTRKYFFDPKVPIYDEHLVWFQNILDVPTDFFYIIEKNSKPAGVVRLNYNFSGLNSCYIVSIYVSPDHYKLGIGSIVLGYIDQLFLGNELHAKIVEKNIASESLFVKCGYVKTKEYGLYIKYPKTGNFLDE